MSRQEEQGQTSLLGPPCPPLSRPKLWYIACDMIPRRSYTTKSTLSQGAADFEIRCRVSCICSSTVSILRWPKGTNEWKSMLSKLSQLAFPTTSFHLVWKIFSDRKNQAQKKKNETSLLLLDCETIWGPNQSSTGPSASKTSSIRWLNNRGSTAVAQQQWPAFCPWWKRKCSPSSEYMPTTVCRDGPNIILSTSNVSD